MRTLSFFFDTRLDFSEPVTEHEFLLRCIPVDAPEQKIESYTLSVLPEGAVTDFGRDAFGNGYCSGRMEKEHSFFRCILRGEACRDDSLREKADASPCYRFPSPLTHPTKEMEDFFESLPKPGDALEFAKMVSSRVHKHFSYEPGKTDVFTTAGEAFRQGRGVCQDYAQVLISLCRMAKIPARYVSGLPVGEGASHAWAEIWADGTWHGLDPTRDCMADEGYLKLCVGRDYNDCPMERGMFLGGAGQTQTVFMKVTSQ